MSGFEVDPVALRAASPKFTTASEKLRDALASLGSVLDAEGACWGGDEAGQKFGEGYQPGAQLGREAFAGLADGLQSIREGLDASAAQWEQVDQAGAQTFGSGG
ncbi:WXG100 family type VII secretion target [Saccharothrix deserti]|uniref:WXG100 family type VII secretion target n=1 Tax=Saccharothrix deserti TaxID=2593674 RepID=UPI00131BF252|nr:WXG100 family type VII secretion target [Saccharothrix deserti]